MDYLIFLCVIIIVILSVIFCVSKINKEVEKFSNSNFTKSGFPLILENIHESVETELENENCQGYKMNEDSSIIIKDINTNEHTNTKMNLNSYILSLKFKLENYNKNNQIVNDCNYKLGINNNKKLELNGSIIDDNNYELNKYYDLNISYIKPTLSVSVDNKNIKTININDNINRSETNLTNSIILGNDGFNGIFSDIDFHTELIEKFNNNVSYINPPIISYNIKTSTSCNITWNDNSNVTAYVLFLYKTKNPEDGVTMKVIKHSDTNVYNYILDNLIENTTYSVFVRAFLDKDKGILSAPSNTETFTPKNTYLHIHNITIPVSKITNYKPCPKNLSK